MPHEMFADAVVRPVSPRARRRRRLLTVLSVVLHITVIVPIAVAQLLAIGPLPIPRRLVVFEVGSVVRVADIPRPAPPAPKGAAPAINPDAAPIVAPRGITPEPIEAPQPSARPDGVEGVPLGFDMRALVAPIEHLEPPPPPPVPRTPVRLFSGMQAPRKVIDVRPLYPPIAIAARKEGVVILEAILDALGNIESVKVLRSDPLLEQAAVDAVKQWKYTPGLLNGVAVPVIMTVTVNFTLQ